MATLEELASNEEIKAEYKKSLLLNLMKKIVGRMRTDLQFNDTVKLLYRQSTNKIITTKVLIQNNLKFELDNEDAKLLTLWMIAFLNKSNTRKPYPIGLKERLIKEQAGRCNVCGEVFGKDLSKIHVDHIIPWSLVGDELDNNYQCLCETCNESKSCHTDYIFKTLINLN